MRNNNIEIMGTLCVSYKENKEKNNSQKKENQRKFSFGDTMNNLNNQTNIEKKEDKNLNKNKKTKIFKNEEKNIEYKIKRICGKGFYTKVYECYILNDNSNEFYALKTISKKILTTNQEKKSIEHMEKELELLKSLKSKYIIEIKDNFKITLENNIKRPFIIYPYYNLDLFSLIKQTNKNIPLNFIKLILHDVYMSISYLHKEKIIYRDLKPENIVIDLNEGRCILIDFGLSIKVNEKDELSELCGTNQYIPPEVILGEKYNFDFDYWTFGIFCYEIVYGFPPFRGNNQKEIFDNIIECNINFSKKENLSNEIEDLIIYLLKKEKEERMEWINIPYHPFFKGLDFNINNLNDNLNQRNEFKSFLNKYKNTFYFVIDEQNIKK